MGKIWVALLDQFTTAHDHVRGAVAPGCFHPIREAAAGKTLQTLDSEWGPQHIAAQILQLCTLMGRQAHIRMNAESIDIGATPSGGSASSDSPPPPQVRMRFPVFGPVAMRQHTRWAYNPASHGGVSHQRILGFAVV